MRVKVVLACTACKQRNYNTKKNKKKGPDRLEMNKYCRRSTERRSKARNEVMAEKAKKENGFVRFTKKAGKFFRDCKGEIKKIVWPTPKNVFKNVGVVLATIILLGLFIFLLDTVFMNLLGLVMQVAK